MYSQLIWQIFQEQLKLYPKFQFNQRLFWDAIFVATKVKIKTKM